MYWKPCNSTLMAVYSPAPRRGSESELSFTANPNTRGFGRGYSTNQARDLKIHTSMVVAHRVGDVRWVDLIISSCQITASPRHVCTDFGFHRESLSPVEPWIRKSRGIH